VFPGQRTFSDPVGILEAVMIETHASQQSTSLFDDLFSLGKAGRRQYEVQLTLDPLDSAACRAVFRNEFA
jgi:hypothetical protein